jgi:hypothetical protein
MTMTIPLDFALALNRAAGRVAAAATDSERERAACALDAARAACAGFYPLDSAPLDSAIDAAARDVIRAAA